MTCWNPFIEFRANVTLYSTCCTAWLDKNVYVGNWCQDYNLIHNLSPWEIWNHPNFQKLRVAILNNDFTTYCKKCSRITAGHLEKDILPWMKPIMDLPPKRIWLEHDRTCNLKCQSCRDQIVGFENTQKIRDSKVFDICEEFFPTAEELVLMSSGEPLVSPSSLEILNIAKDFSNLKVELFSNATLLLNKWDSLPQKQIWKFNLSIDAASKNIYEKVRFPSKWEHIYETLEFISTLNKVVQLNFCVQADNFRDIPDFIQMCIDFGFQHAHLAAMLKVWHSQELYDSMNICDPRHPEHKDLLEVLKHPLLKHPITLCPTLYHLMES